MSGHDHGAAGFEKLAREYWSAFGNFAQSPAPGPAIPGWKEGLAWWTQLASQGSNPFSGHPMSGQMPGNPQIDAALGRMNAQTGDWYGLMQQIAAGFAGRDAGAEQIAKAWQQALGGAVGPNGIADMFKRMTGPGAQGFEHWLAQVGPWLQSLRIAAPNAAHEQLSAALRLPTFGVAREHQERWQALLQAQLDYQQADAGFSEQLLRTGKRAFERFESKLEERSEPGRQLDSARALFDLWIDAAEEAWAEIAMTAEFRVVYGKLANAQMRLRGAIQTEIEQVTGQFGLPTRTEMDASHRKVAALERELRALKRQIEAAGDTRAATASPARAKVAARGAPTPAPAAPEPASAPAPKRNKQPARSKRAAAPARTKRSHAVLPTVAAPRAIERGATRRVEAKTKPAAKKKARK